MRRPLDAYSTPGFFTEALLKMVQIQGSVYEPCVGRGMISEVLRKQGLKVLTNDLDKAVKAHLHKDAASPDAWKHKVDWVVTNPPFSRASEIVKLAYEHSTVGIAFLLRLSFLEPCKDRADWLRMYPPTAVFVLPRISWTEDGGKDQVTAMWAVWDKTRKDQMIRVLSKCELMSLE